MHNRPRAVMRQAAAVVIGDDDSADLLTEASAFNHRAEARPESLCTMVHLDPYDQLRLQRLAEHLHRCGARTVAEAFAEVALRIGGAPAIFTVLGEFEQRLRPDLLQAVGGDRPLREVLR